MRKDKTITFNVVDNDTLANTPATCNLDVKPKMRVKTRIKAGACFSAS